MKEKINLFLSELRKMRDFNKVKFIILYGSYAEGKENKFSDIDFVIYYDGSPKERFKLRLKLLAKLSEQFDIQIFQDLPLPVRKDTLKGRLIYAKDEGFIYDIAYDTIKAFEDFKKGYYDYIGMEEIAA